MKTRKKNRPGLTKKKSPDMAGSEQALASLRGRIDRLDVRIVELLNRRTRLAMAIGRIKHQRGDPVFTPGRERDVVKKVTAASSGPLGRGELKAIYREIMSAALRFEGGLVVGVWAGDGAGAQWASRLRLGDATRVKTFTSRPALLKALAGGSISFAVVSARNRKVPPEGAVDAIELPGRAGTFYLLSPGGRT